MINKKNKKLEKYLRTMAHFLNRLRERYRIIMKQDEYDSICKKIRDRKIEIFPLSHKDKRGSSFEIVIHGALVSVVFNYKNGYLVTALSRGHRKLVYN